MMTDRDLAPGELAPAQTRRALPAQSFDPRARSTRRGMLLAPLLAALPLGFLSTPAEALNRPKQRSFCPTNTNGRRGPAGRHTAPRWRHYTAGWTRRVSTSC